MTNMIIKSVILMCLILYIGQESYATDPPSDGDKKPEPQSPPHSSDTSMTGKNKITNTPAEAEFNQKTETMLSNLISITKKNGKAELMVKPEKGEDVNAILNPQGMPERTRGSHSTTVRPAIGSAAENNKEDKEATCETYLPLYACDDVNSYTMPLEPLYKGCLHGCQVKEPVEVTLLKLQAPKPYKSQIEVIWLSAVQMYDMCHEDVWGGEHRVKSAVEYPLSDTEIDNIIREVQNQLVFNQDLIHGKYPKADCSYWQDTRDSSIVTRVRKSHFDLFYAPELGDYYLHLPMDQVNVMMWDSKFDGPSGSYRWKRINTDIPCLLKTDEQITCLGSMKKGDNLQCASVGVVLEAPYITSHDPGCKMMTTKDTRGTHFNLVKETTMSYRDAIKDSNPNVQSLGNALSHIEELLCMAGCNELTMMSISNNTNLVVDTPVGIWKRKTGTGSLAVQCSAMSTGKIELLTPICTIMGVVGIKHLGSSSTTYHWDMMQLYATTAPHVCMTETISDLTPLLRHQENGTLIMDTFAGRVELNTKTGESRFLYYNEDITINKQRWFPNVMLDQQDPETSTDSLEIAIMQQMRNLSAEYQESCKETKGPVVLKTIGGAVWMLEEDITTYWSNLFSYFYVWKYVVYVLIVWAIIYIIILMLGLFRTIFAAKKMIRVPVNYKRAHKNDN